MEETLDYFKKNNVNCKKVENGKEPFIAVFGYGKLTRKQISKKIKSKNLLCMFFEESIRVNSKKKEI